jgi:Rrf2 family protein
MKFNTKTRYGLRTMIEVSMRGNGKGILQKEISERQEISFKYLDQIIASLKASGLIANAEGRISGYTLSKDPAKISVYDIYKAFEHELYIVDCLEDEGICRRDRLCAAREFWNDLNNLIVEYLKSKKLKELSQEQEKINESEAANMFHI